MKPTRILLTVLFIACLAGGLTLWADRLHAQTPTPAYSQVVIPFELRQGMIIVHATVGGKDVPCLVDTGTSEIVWPKSLNLGGAPAIVQTPDGKTGTLQFHLHTTAGKVIEGTGVILPSIQIGSFNLQTMVTDCVDNPDPSAPAQMVLGTRAFQQGSLTIDYAHRRLVVRTSGYDAASDSLSAGAHLMPFQWFDGAPLGAGRPAVEGTIDGHPILLAIDTGANSMSIPASFYKAYLSKKQLYQGTVSSGGQKAVPVNTVHGLTLSFGGISIKDQPAALVEGALPGGLIGYDQLKRFAITIDYVHHKILLQSNVTVGK